MKRLACALVGAILSTAVLTAAPPDRSRTYTTPLPPAREALDRLNLQMAWRLYVPMDGRRDGLATVQLRGRDLFVQTRSGLVGLIDAEAGVLRWRTRVGLPYRVEHALAFNSREVYVVNSTYLYALDRATGNPRWQFRLPEGVSAPPVADENMVFIAAPSGRFTAYYLPRPELPTALAGGMTEAYDLPQQQRKETPEERRKRVPSIRGETVTSSRVSYLTPTVHDASGDEEFGPKPVRVWSEMTSLRLELPVLYTREYLLLPEPNGIVLALAKVPKESGAASEIYRFPTDSPIRVPAGHFEDMAYVGAEDANLYALQVSNGRLRWRYTAGTPISRQPAVTEQDIYIVAERNGMTRLDRATGQPMWRVPARGQLAENNSAADRFLAVNPKYVYAADASGRLLVLDRRRGITLSTFELTDFVVPVPNETTDRLYLAANNGLIVCLHDREYPTPLRHRKAEEEADDPIRKRLAEPVSDPGTPEKALREMLADLTRRFPPLKFQIDARAFQAAGAEPPDGKNVKIPKVDNKPLGEVLAAILAPINCTFEVIGDTIMILPAAAPPAP